MPRAIAMLYVIHVWQRSPTTRVGALGTNRFFDCGSRKAAWRSSTLLPLLQCSIRDL